jgi:hypothetical protein
MSTTPTAAPPDTVSLRALIDVAHRRSAEANERRNTAFEASRAAGHKGEAAAAYQEAREAWLQAWGTAEFLVAVRGGEVSL